MLGGWGGVCACGRLLVWNLFGVSFLDGLVFISVIFKKGVRTIARRHPGCIFSANWLVYDFSDSLECLFCCPDRCFSGVDRFSVGRWEDGSCSFGFAFSGVLVGLFGFPGGFVRM